MVSTVSDLLDEKDALPTTLVSYRALLRPVAHLPLTERESIDAFLRSRSNVNPRRATANALRAIAYECKIPRGIPRPYDLPNEEKLRLVLSYSKYEVQYLTMMFMGLRIGEA